MAEIEKDIIYLDHDAEITEAIEKLKASDQKTVRLVVPGRSTLLQSLVNLKLLKRAADNGKKDLVLVTTDKTASNLASKLGIPIAKNVKATPHLVAAEPEPLASPLVADAEDDRPDIDDDVPVHRFDNEDDAGSAAASRKRKPKATKAAAKSSKGSKIPNYSKFQKGLIVAAGVIGVLLLFWLASAFLQTATINVQATAERYDVSADFAISTTDSAATSVVATPLEVSKDITQSFQATGKKDNGTKASGNVAIRNCEDSDPHALAAGSRLTTGGKNFTTSSAVTIPAGDFSGGGTVCKSSTVQVAVTAAENGDGYNFSNATFVVGGMSARITGSGTTQGGSSKVINIVAQSDIDTATKAAVDGAKAEALSELRDKAKDNYKVFEDSITSTVVSTTATPVAGAEGTTGSAAVKVKFTLLTVEKTQLEALIKDQLKGVLTNGAEVLDPGLDEAEFKQTKAAKDNFSYSLKTTAYIGQAIDKVALAKQAAGKAKKDVADLARTYSNVTGVTVDGWPLVPQMPLNPGNIKVQVLVSK